MALVIKIWLAEINVQSQSNLADVNDWNQLKTFAAESDKFMYAKGRKMAMKRVPTHGTPCLVVLTKIFGACPLTARANNVLAPAISPRLAAEKAEVKTAALMICGRTFIPALLMATTNGDEEALPELLAISGLLYGTIKVRQKIVVIISTVTL